jgi:hypothetical protein
LAVEETDHEGDHGLAASAAGLSAMVAVVPGGQMGSVATDNELKAEVVVDAKGARRLSNHVSVLGTWAVAADQGQDSEELHVVYASPGTITAYRKDGHFS